MERLIVKERTGRCRLFADLLNSVRKHELKTSATQMITEKIYLMPTFVPRRTNDTLIDELIKRNRVLFSSCNIIFHFTLVQF